MIKKIISIITAFIMSFAGYPLSFLPRNTDKEFIIGTGEFSQNTVFIDGASTEYALDSESAFANGTLTFDDKITLSFDGCECDWFNYFGIEYSADCYIRGEITYAKNKSVFSEEFFLEPAEKGEFFSFIDGLFDNVKANRLISVSFVPLNSETAVLSLDGISFFNREIPDREVYIQNENIRIGADLTWGGALSYFEDLDSDVETVRVDGQIKVDSKASERYGKKALSKNVNLINRNDSGRLVQQSYYGSNGSSGDGYVPGIFMDNVWNYNPVQGGNQYNESSKIVDLRVTDNVLYVKCRPLDWALPKENISPSYMEATYTLDGKLLKAECRFVDFSGYEPYYTSQEIPAFYCIEPLNRYVYYSGDNAWSDEPLTVIPDLIFWPDAGYPNFISKEHWSGFIGEFDDSFGMGVYVPDETVFLSGVFDRGNCKDKDPSKENPTSYIAVIKFRVFQSFDPYSYEFYLTSGDSSEMRETFLTLG